MSEKDFYIGTTGPFTYEDTDVDTYPDAAPTEALRVAQCYVEDTPTEDYHIARKKYVDDAFSGWNLTGRLAAGYVPCVYPINFSGSAAYTDSLSLPADGGCVAIPFNIAARIYLQSASFRSLETSGEHTLGWALYLDSYADSAARVAYSTADYTWTATGASNIGITAASAPVLLAPGTYWLVLQNRHASNTFSFGTFSGVSAFCADLAQTKTATNPIGANLLMITGPWTKITNICAARLNARVFGDSVIF